MAKWGEGDARWKVTDLGEAGRNVNSWHWEESNVLPWCRARLEELLGKDVLVLVDDGHVRVTSAGNVKVTGDAVINRRKGKVIPAYELDVSFDWKGTTVGDEDKAWQGTVKAPYISEENHDEDPEVQISVKEEGAAAERVRSAIVTHGRKVVYEVLGKFVKELRAGGNGTSIPEEGSPGDEDTVVMVDAPQKASLEKGLSGGTSRIEKRSLEMVEIYYASSRDIYECFTHEGKVKAYTGSSASIKAEEGGSFSMFGGSIEGLFTRLEPYSCIEMDWRFSSWPDGSMSKVKVLLEEKEKGSVTLTLRQEGIPDTDRFGNHDVVNMTRSGWKQQVLNRMKQVFGYGM